MEECLEETVSKLSTRLLLKKLNYLRKFQSLYLQNYDFGLVKDLHRYTIEEIRQILKDELATREHVPNKIEARKIRQMKAKHRNGKVKC